MNVIVKHIRNTRDAHFLQGEELKEHARSEAYDLVAVLDIASDTALSLCNTAYRMTQHIEEHWTYAESVSSVHMLSDRIRSSMIGDIFQIGSTEYVVATLGFLKL